MFMEQPNNVEPWVSKVLPTCIETAGEHPRVVRGHWYLLFVHLLHA